MTTVTSAAPENGIRLRMVARIAIQLTYSVAVTLVAVSVVFALLHFSGDPISALAPPGSAPEDLDRLRALYGLDRPLGVQYVRFVANAAQGDFGDSWRTGEPARGVVLERMPATLTLIGLALTAALVVAVPLGTAAGLGRGGPVVSVFVIAGQALPGFWLGTVLMLLFAVRLEWLPPSGNASASALVLPVLTLALYPAAAFTRLVRASVAETVHADFVRTAEAKGLGGATIAINHVLRNALLPVIAYVAVQAGLLLSGAVIVEWVFAYPGAGQLALQAVASRDLPVVLVVVIISAVVVVLANALADLLSAILDPRLRDVSTGRG